MIWFQEVLGMLPTRVPVRAFWRIAQRDVQRREALRALRRRHRAGDRVPQVWQATRALVVGQVEASEWTSRNHDSSYMLQYVSEIGTTSGQGQSSRNIRYLSQGDKLSLCSDRKVKGKLVTISDFVRRWLSQYPILKTSKQAFER